MPDLNEIAEKMASVQLKATGIILWPMHRPEGLQWMGCLVDENLVRIPATNLMDYAATPREAFQHLMVKAKALG